MKQLTIYFTTWFNRPPRQRPAIFISANREEALRIFLKSNSPSETDTHICISENDGKDFSVFPIPKSFAVGRLPSENAASPPNAISVPPANATATNHPEGKCDSRRAAETESIFSDNQFVWRTLSVIAVSVAVFKTKWGMIVVFVAGGLFLLYSYLESKNNRDTFKSIGKLVHKYPFLFGLLFWTLHGAAIVVLTLFGIVVYLFINATGARWDTE
jgi:hypothetical protein